MKILNNHLKQLRENEILSGDIAFQLHDTYGFPMELTQEIAQERNVQVDTEQFNAAMRIQQERGKADSSIRGANADLDPKILKAIEKLPTTNFEGYKKTEFESEVLFVDDDYLVLDSTPFYAEAGGQIGDAGTATGENGIVTITDTTSLPTGHYLHVIGETDGKINVGERVIAKINIDRRLKIQRHHTGTHLLHWALRRVLGDHVKQQGSWVGPEHLRFDFSHFEAPTEQELEQIENLVNQEVFSGMSVDSIETTMEEAKELGALAFFGDKYGDNVRVLKAGENSIELCGGTHVTNLSDIGPMKILSEGSIGSNIRRVEAVSGTGAIDLIRKQQRKIEEVANDLGVPASNLIDGVAKKLREIEKLTLEIKGLRKSLVESSIIELFNKVEHGVIAEKLHNVSRDDLRDLINALTQKENVKAVILGVALDNGGVALAAGVPKGSSLIASDLIHDATKLIKGGGGKGEDFAMAGGKDNEALEEAIQLARQKAELG